MQLFHYRACPSHKHWIRPIWSYWPFFITLHSLQRGCLQSNASVFFMTSRRSLKRVRIYPPLWHVSPFPIWISYASFASFGRLWLTLVFLHSSCERRWKKFQIDATSKKPSLSIPLNAIISLSGGASLFNFSLALEVRAIPCGLQTLIWTCSFFVLVLYHPSSKSTRLLFLKSRQSLNHPCPHLTPPPLCDMLVRSHLK